MPQSVYTDEEIRLQNGDKLRLRALTLKNRRSFMKAYKAYGTPVEVEEGQDELTEEELELHYENELLKLVASCVPGQNAEWDKVFSDDPEEVSAALDSMADALTEDDMMYIIKQVGGIDLKENMKRFQEMVEKNPELLGTISTSQA